MITNEHIAYLGFRLEFTSDVQRISPLLNVCGVPLPDEKEPWGPSSYLIATTTAGGIAACVGWTHSEKRAILHSLAVGPSTRGSGIGASQLAMAMGIIKEQLQVDEIFICTEKAREFFEGFGFQRMERAEVPEEIIRHSSFTLSSGNPAYMVRSYHDHGHGLDHRAFRLIHNTTQDGSWAPGSVFLFRQSGDVLESHYRGGLVRRGHLIGSMDGPHLRFLWHHCTHEGKLISGKGEIAVAVLKDGRRELRETLESSQEKQSGELLLREV